MSSDEASALSPRRRRLGESLRLLRHASDLSGEHLAERLGWSQSKVSKIETGRTRPSVSDVRAWCSATATAEAVAERLVRDAEDLLTDASSWREVHANGLAAKQRRVADLESRATSISVFQPSLVPGLLQTADYARRVLELANVSGQSDLAAAVTARLDRQAALFDESKSFDFVLTEGALLWRPGPVSVMRAQYDRIASVATLPNVSIHVLPFGDEATALWANAFVLFDTPDEGKLVTVETLTTELILSDPPDVETYKHSFGRLVDAAKAGPALGEIWTRSLGYEQGDRHPRT